MVGNVENTIFIFNVIWQVQYEFISTSFLYLYEKMIMGTRKDYGRLVLSHFCISVKPPPRKGHALYNQRVAMVGICISLERCL